MNPRLLRIARASACLVLVAACSGVTDLPATDAPRESLATDSGSATPVDSAPAPTSPSPAPSALPALASAPKHPTGRTEIATLVRVVDGDTIRVMVGRVEERVRYIGMNTPELNVTSAATPEPYAEAATVANADLLARGGQLVLERDVSQRDRYGRLLRNVWLNNHGRWTLINLALVLEGYAQVTTYPPDVKYVKALLAAQRAARDAKRGLWGTSP